jgi:hypothetical protein
MLASTGSVLLSASFALADHRRRASVIVKIKADRSVSNCRWLADLFRPETQAEHARFGFERIFFGTFGFARKS